MHFEPQLPYVPDLTGLPVECAPDWDEVKSEPSNAAADYKLLRRCQYLRPGQLAAIKERNYNNLVVEVVILSDSRTTKGQIETTRASLGYQEYDRIHVTVLDLSSKTVAAHLSAMVNPWAWIIYAGDTLAPYSVLIAVDTIHAFPEMVMFYTDEEKVHDGYPIEPFYKSDLSLEWLRAGPYVGRGVLVQLETLRNLEIDQFADRNLIGYEVILRAVERYGRYCIGHIRETLYQSPTSYNEWLLNPKLAQSSASLVRAHLDRSGLSSTQAAGLTPGTLRIRYTHAAQPKVSIIIPVRDQVASLRRLIDGILGRTMWGSYELILVDAQSTDPAMGAFVGSLITSHPDQVTVVPFLEPFNFARMLQAGIKKSAGEYLAFMHPDMQVTQGDWLFTMMSYALCPDVGVVGCKIIFPHGAIQHAGVVLGMQGVAGHVHYKNNKDHDGYHGRLKVPQDVSAVTAAGSVISRKIYDEVGGFDSEAFPLYYHDVDLCVRINQHGYRVIWTPYVTHLTDDTSLMALDTTHVTVREARVKSATAAIRKNAFRHLSDDPFYHPHLSLNDSTPTQSFRSSLAWAPFEHSPLPRVFTFPGDKSGCGFYRTRGPLDAMVAAGLAEGMASEWMVPVSELQRLKADVLILQRKINDGQLDYMDEYQKYLPNTFRVYELDDPLHLIPPKSIHYGQFPKDVFQRMVRGIQSCDRLVVSTQPLADVFEGYHHDIVIRQNRLIPRYWRHIKSRRMKNLLPRIGWGGGSSHRGDLEMIGKVIEHFHGKVHWVFFGMLPDSLKPFVREFHSSVNINVYPTMMASLNLDLALAPVEDNEFNRCKSNLRVLEYGACGYPVIASDVAAYQSDLPITLCSSDPDDWIAAINEHIQDLNELERRGQRLRAAIHKDWFLEGQNVNDWLAAWQP